MDGGSSQPDCRHTFFFFLPSRSGSRVVSCKLQQYNSHSHSSRGEIDWGFGLGVGRVTYNFGSRLSGDRDYSMKKIK